MMALAEDREWSLEIDRHRYISLIPTEDGASVVITLMDRTGVAIVELTRLELDELIAALDPYRR
jgi:hypothetical protein